MSWLSIISGAIKLAGTIAAYLKDQLLLDAGAKAQIVRNLVELTRRAGITDQVRAQIEAMSEDDLDAELRGDK